ncbi:HNH endonuclease [Aliarcobacter butzleri]
MEKQNIEPLKSLNTIKCVYCTNEFKEGEGSLEHVILSSLGGRKGSRNICCEECNGRLGTEIDKPVADFFSFYSNMLGIRTGRNKDASVIKNIIKIGDSLYDMLPEGKFELSKNKVDIQELDNIKKISVSAKDVEQAKNIFKNIIINQLKLDPKSIINVEATSNKIYPPIIHREFVFGGDEQYRSYAKTILTYLATLVKPERIREDGLKDIINYINGLAHKNKYPILYNGILSLPLEPKLSNINHRVFIHASNIKNKVIGILEIFGSIKISCILSNEWKYSNISKVYVVDPVTSKTLNEDIILSESLVNECINMKTSLDNESINHLKDDISKLMREIAERQHNSRRQEQIKAAMEMFLPEEGELITDDVIYKLSNYLANEFVNDLCRIDRKEDIELNFEGL